MASSGLARAQRTGPARMCSKRPHRAGAAFISDALSHMLPGMEVDPRSGVLTTARQLSRRTAMRDRRAWRRI